MSGFWKFDWTCCHFQLFSYFAIKMDKWMWGFQIFSCINVRSLCPICSEVFLQASSFSWPFKLSWIRHQNWVTGKSTETRFFENLKMPILVNFSWKGIISFKFLHAKKHRRTLWGIHSLSKIWVITLLSTVEFNLGLRCLFSPLAGKSNQLFVICEVTILVFF